MSHFSVLVLDGCFTFTLDDVITNHFLITLSFIFNLTNMEKKMTKEEQLKLAELIKIQMKK
jgi:hypothetical protein